MLHYIGRQSQRILVFILLLIAYLTNSTQLSLATRYAGSQPAVAKRFIGTMLITVAILLVGFNWIYNRQLRQNNPRHFGHLKVTWRRVGQLVLAFILILVIQLIWSQLITHHLLPMPSNQSELNNQTQQLPFWNDVYGVLFAPVFEEYLFRGIFFNDFFSKNTRFNTVVGVLVSGFIFGFLHTLSFSVTTLFYSSLGWLLAGTYLYFKDIRYSMALHFLNNLWSII